ncbi:MAG: hypothetical protein KDN20_00245 [Verrucomicrobiae bacterium]|nr:hypothetical protein [Verrucomicrobiae bacterium]
MNRRPLSFAICLVVPFVILVLGLGTAGWQGYQASRLLVREAGRGVVPPGFSVELTESGEHTLWLHTYTMHEGAAFESGEQLPPGAKIIITHDATGDIYPLNPYSMATKSLGSETAVSLGTFEPRSTGRISVMGTGISKPVVLSVAPVKMREMLNAAIQVGGIAAMSLLLAIVSLIVLLHRRQKMMRAEEQMHGGHSPSHPH